jgi:hypothetical protein
MIRSASPDGTVSPLVGPLLQAFFVEHLCGQKRASSRTIQSYRNTCRLLLQFLRETTERNRPPW